MARILFACLALEANSFAPGITTLKDFQSQTFAVGKDIHPAILGPTSELAAAWKVIEDAGHEVVPAIVAWSGPRPRIARGALDEIIRIALEYARDIDGVYVMLHGSAIAEGEDDPEGALLSQLRARAGPDIPIVASVDCHAHLTARMVASLDALTAYRTCPHVDTARTGAQAARLLSATIAGRIRPQIAVAAAPMITPADRHDSQLDPFRALMAMCDKAEEDGALAAAFLPVQPWLDLPDLGWKVAVTAEDGQHAQQAAEKIISHAWAVREQFLQGRRPPIEEALSEALKGESPFVLADAGDSPSGGSPGDSTELLRASLTRHSGQRILMSILAPHAAALASRAGVGAELELELGVGELGAYNQLVRVKAAVRSTFNGEFRYTHPVAAGYRGTTGKAALVQVRDTNILLALHSHIVMVLDPSIFKALGARPEDAHVVQAKSHVSYRAGFAPVTNRSVVADTPGPTSANLRSLPYHRVTRPLFPLDDI